MFSKCVKDLPRSEDGGPTVWDLRELRVPEGATAPVGAAVVKRYLDIIYRRLDSSRRVAVPRSLEAARPLLQFADAVASSAVVFESLDSTLANADGLCLTVRVDEQLQLELALQGHLYTLSTTAGLMDYPYFPPGRVIRPSTDEHLLANMQQIRDAVSSALEEWLHLTGRLRMNALLRLLLRFAKTQLIPIGGGLISEDGIYAMYSPRVLQVLPPEVLLEGFLRDCLRDLPSEVRLEAKGVSAALASPNTACFMPLEPSAAKQCDLVALQGGKTKLTDGRSSARFTALIGGLFTDACERIVQGLLSRAASDVPLS